MSDHTETCLDNDLESVMIVGEKDLATKIKYWRGILNDHNESLEA